MSSKLTNFSKFLILFLLLLPGTSSGYFAAKFMSDDFIGKIIIFIIAFVIATIVSFLCVSFIVFKLSDEIKNQKDV